MGIGVDIVGLGVNGRGRGGLDCRMSATTRLVSLRRDIAVDIKSALGWNRSTPF